MYKCAFCTFNSSKIIETSSSCSLSSGAQHYRSCNVNFFLENVKKKNSVKNVKLIVFNIK